MKRSGSDKAVLSRKRCGTTVAKVWLATPMTGNSKNRILMLPALCFMLWSQSLRAADGLDTWYLRSSPLSATNWLFNITYANNRFVAVGGDSAPFLPGGGVIVTSSDGSNWTQRLVSSGTLLHVTYGGGIFLAGGG